MRLHMNRTMAITNKTEGCRRNSAGTKIPLSSSTLKVRNSAIGNCSIRASCLARCFTMRPSVVCKSAATPVRVLGLTIRECTISLSTHSTGVRGALLGPSFWRLTRIAPTGSWTGNFAKVLCHFIGLVFAGGTCSGSGFFSGGGSGFFSGSGSGRSFSGSGGGSRGSYSCGSYSCGSDSGSGSGRSFCGGSLSGFNHGTSGTYTQHLSWFLEFADRVHTFSLLLGVWMSLLTPMKVFATA